MIKIIKQIINTVSALTFQYQLILDGVAPKYQAVFAGNNVCTWNEIKKCVKDNCQSNDFY